MHQRGHNVGVGGRAAPFQRPEGRLGGVRVVVVAMTPELFALTWSAIGCGGLRSRRAIARQSRSPGEPMRPGKGGGEGVFGGGLEGASAHAVPIRPAATEDWTNVRRSM